MELDWVKNCRPQLTRHGSGSIVAILLSAFAASVSSWGWDERIGTTNQQLRVRRCSSRSKLLHSGAPRSSIVIRGVRISMDGRGRAFDNIFIERLWRTERRPHFFELTS